MTASMPNHGRSAGQFSLLKLLDLGYYSVESGAHVGRKRIEEEAVGITERKQRPESVQEHKCPIDFKRHIPTHVYYHSVGIANLA